MKAPVQESKQSPSLADLLGVLVENKGSELHLQSGEVPIGRIHGELGRFEMPALTEADVLRLARGVARQTAQAILNARHREEQQARSRHSRQFVRF
jgi:Tfp pilus assembly pilus retraction ATPase PilT